MTGDEQCGRSAGHGYSGGRKLYPGYDLIVDTLWQSWKEMVEMAQEFKLLRFAPAEVTE